MKLIKWLDEHHGAVTMMATIVLVIITAFYAWQTFELNKITYNSFESSNRPYIYPLLIQATNIDLTKSDYEVVIGNLGESPARLFSIYIGSESCSSNVFPLKEFDETTLILPGQNRSFSFKETGGLESFKIKLIVNYTGIGELNSKHYTYTSEIAVNKSNKKIDIYEGKI